MSPRLPADPATTQLSPAAHSSTGGEPPGARILVVDDEVFIRSAVQLYLETVGYSVEVAESGARAVEIIGRPGDPGPDAVILDLVMPGMTGFEVLRVIRQQQPTTEVIIATGCGTLATAIEALRNGAFDYIQKPIVNFDQDLLPVVRQAVESRRSRSRPVPPAMAAPAASGNDGRLIEVLAEIARLAHGRDRAEPLLGHCGAILAERLAWRGAILRREANGSFLPRSVFGGGEDLAAAGVSWRPASAILERLGRGEVLTLPADLIIGAKPTLAPGGSALVIPVPPGPPPAGLVIVQEMQALREPISGSRGSLSHGQNLTILGTLLSALLE